MGLCFKLSRFLNGQLLFVQTFSSAIIASDCTAAVVIMGQLVGDDATFESIVDIGLT